MKSRFYIFLAVLVLVMSWLLTHNLSKAKPPLIAYLACADITKSCGNDLFTVRFAEQPQAMRPLHFILHLNQAISPAQIHVDFAMKGMAMGLNRYRLVHVNDDWQADVTLPVCVQGRSDWEMLVEIEAEGGVKRFIVPFSAEKPS